MDASAVYEASTCLDAAKCKSRTQACKPWYSASSVQQTMIIVHSLLIMRLLRLLAVHFHWRRHLNTLRAFGDGDWPSVRLRIVPPTLIRQLFASSLSRHLGSCWTCRTVRTIIISQARLTNVIIVVEYMIRSTWHTSASCSHCCPHSGLVPLSLFTRTSGPDILVVRVPQHGLSRLSGSTYTHSKNLALHGC